VSSWTNCILSGAEREVCVKGKHGMEYYIKEILKSNHTIGYEYSIIVNTLDSSKALIDWVKRIWTQTLLGESISVFCIQDTTCVSRFCFVVLL